MPEILLKAELGECFTGQPTVRGLILNPRVDVEIPRLCMNRWCPLLVILISCGSTAPVVFTRIFPRGEQS